MHPRIPKLLTFAPNVTNKCSKLRLYHDSITYSFFSHPVYSTITVTFTRKKLHLGNYLFKVLI